ncbi:hypothetical protein Nepgr_027044 [Nepenthes gracilis]|uniref:Uncharacterized protein n=1 Tax=Nepenthes gracilis TaxID=150966 RepID=A0AAD3Y358_NEPGR|nr:hypothetical protein Nepgr_027044 [Nepenthes gracilis]
MWRQKQTECPEQLLGFCCLFSTLGAAKSDDNFINIPRITSRPLFYKWIRGRNPDIEIEDFFFDVHSPVYRLLNSQAFFPLVMETWKDMHFL